MRSLQLVLRRYWDFQDPKMMVPWDSQCQEDLRWWSQKRLEEGISLKVSLPDLHFWSDASDQGWGAFLGPEGTSGLWSLRDKQLSINLRELKAIRLGLFHFEESVVGRNLAVFCDNTTAVAYLRN